MGSDTEKAMERLHEAETGLGTHREIANKAYLYGVRIVVEDENGKWSARVLRRSDDLVIETKGPYDSAAEAQESARRWATAEAARQVQKWINEHGTAEKVVRMLGNGDEYAALQRAAAQIHDEATSIPEAGLEGARW